MLDIAEMGLPLVTTIHHPITFDRRIDIATAPTLRKKLTSAPLVRLPEDAGQGRPPASAGSSPSPSPAGATSSATSGSTRTDIQVIPLGVDEVFRPPTEPRVPGRIVAMASADAPMKGIATLLEAFAKLRTEREVELLLVSRPDRGGRTERLIDAARHRRARQLRQRHQRRRAGRGDGLRRGRLRALALRGLLAADGRADGLRDAAGGEPRRRDPRGGRSRRRVRRPGHPGRRGRARARARDLLDDPERRARMGKAGRAGCSTSSAGTRWPWPPRRRTSA